VADEELVGIWGVVRTTDWTVEVVADDAPSIEGVVRASKRGEFDADSDTTTGGVGRTRADIVDAVSSVISDDVVVDVVIFDDCVGVGLTPPLATGVVLFDGGG
jgi:hypothetical protein